MYMLHSVAFEPVYVLTNLEELFNSKPPIIDSVLEENTDLNSLSIFT